MAYVSTGGVIGLCGCNGQEWGPLTADPRSHRVCVNLQKASCVGSYPNAIPQAGTVNPALPRRNLEANAGEGGWQPVTRTYGGFSALT